MIKDDLTTRYDLFAFVGAFLAGVILYFYLYVIADAHQVAVSAAMIAVMAAYTFLAFRLPLLRVRQDQAGDNAYYLGLLFTLMSMAYALYEFGAALNTSGRTVEQSGTRQIIANFGIALASTITGIFLRVLLQQIRVDPSDLENVTRIEMVEVSKRVRANVENVTIELGRFHDEIRQRSNDVVNVLFEETRKSTEQMHKRVLDEVHEMTRELAGAIERLRSIEPPPVALSESFEKVTKALQTSAEKTEGIAVSLQGISQAAEGSFAKIQEAATLLGRLAAQMEGAQTTTAEKIATAVEKVSTALTTVGDQLHTHLGLYAQLEEQSRRSAAESVRAQAAAVEVLTRMTEVTKGLTTMLRAAARNDLQ
jgi:low affinity Fe/Cu permease